MLYGVENWIFSAESLQRLESFQGEVERILKLPCWYSNTAACVALDIKSMHSVCTVRKLRFLHRVTTNEVHRVMTNEESICYRAFSAMVDNVEVLSLVKECRDLEELISHRRFSMLLILQQTHIALKVALLRKIRFYS